MNSLQDLAVRLDTAACDAAPIPQLTEAWPELGAAEAYAIQALSVGRRLVRGERMIGLKLGLTSRAKMQQVNVDEAIFGRLTDAMIVEEGNALRLAAFIHPRAEPELAFLLRRELVPDASLTEAAAAVEAVLPAIEIIDSRYRNFQFRLADVVADNTSAAALVLGPPHRLADIGNLGMVLRLDGRPSKMGSSAAILGHPLRALTAAAKMLPRLGLALPAGSIVLAGAATEAVALAAGSWIDLCVEGMEPVGFATA